MFEKWMMAESPDYRSSEADEELGEWKAERTPNYPELHRTDLWRRRRFPRQLHEMAGRMKHTDRSHLYQRLALP